MKKVLLVIAAALLLLGCAAPEKKVVSETVFYPPLPQQPRLQFLTVITSEEDIGKKQSSFQEFLLGDIPPLKKLDRPYDMGAVKGKIYVSDRTHKQIVIIDLENKTFNSISSIRGGTLGDPAGIWVTEDDIKYVADFKRKQIVVFDQENNYIRSYGDPETLDKPLDVAVFENRVYVCDFNQHKIIVFEKESGEIVQTIGDIGADEGKFYKPTHLTVDQLGYIYVNDSFNFRMQKFDQSGELVKVVGYHGDTVGGFARPKGLSIDREDHLYVVDTAFENVQIFDANTGDVLLFFGGFGQGIAPGAMYLPNGIYIDYNNVDYFSQYADREFKVRYLVYVGNMLGKKKLNVYGFGDWIGEKLPDMK